MKSDKEDGLYKATKTLLENAKNSRLENNVNKGTLYGLIAGFTATAVVSGYCLYSHLIGKMPDPQVIDTMMAVSVSSIAAFGLGTFGMLSGAVTGATAGLGKEGIESLIESYHRKR